MSPITRGTFPLTTTVQDEAANHKLPQVFLNFRELPRFYYLPYQVLASHLLFGFITMNYRVSPKHMSPKGTGTRQAHTDYLCMMQTASWHSQEANMLREEKRLRREVGILAKRNHGHQKQIRELVARVQM